MITRRAFVAGAAAALAAAPRLAWAQERLPRVAIVDSSRPIEDLETSTTVVFWFAFYAEMRRIGWVQNESVIIEPWTAAGRGDLDAFAREVVESAPDVIWFIHGSVLAPSFLSASRTIPMVAITADPVRLGFVTNLARPGGNLTGFTADAGRELEGKRLQLLLDCVPGAKRIAYIAGTPDWTQPLRQFLVDAARQLGASIESYVLESPITVRKIEDIFAAMSAEPPDAVYTGQSGNLYAYHGLISELSLAAGLPSMFPNRRPVADNGGLLSYAPNWPDMARRCAGYVDRILRGEKPAEMPFQQPTVFDFAINLNTARELGITIPPAIMIQATEFIE